MIGSTLVDSNVILDVATEDTDWIDWSASMLAEAGQRGPLVINPLIYAEVSVQYATVEALDDALPPEYYTRAALPWEAGFLAAKCFVTYRRRGGVKQSPLPDFYIGAHAAVAGLTLLTRDARRYRTYFPRLRIIAP
jgi:predicted nucleic acid-binding protein